LPRFFKSRYLSDPIVYSQDDETWRSYAPGGVVHESAGAIPEFILANAAEVPEEEVRELIVSRLREAEKIETQQSWTTPPVAGLGGWLILPIIGLFLSCLWAGYGLYWNIIPAFRFWGNLTSPGSPGYHPLWAPWLLFDTFALAVLLFAPIVLLVLVFRKSRILPRLIIYFYLFALLVVIVDFVALVSFAVSAAGNAGLAIEANSWVRSGVESIVRGLLVTGIWIPYFLFSRRVRNTFVRGRRPSRLAVAADPPADSASVSPATASASADAERRVPRRILFPVVGALVVALAALVGVTIWQSGNQSNDVAAALTGFEKVRHYASTADRFSFDYPANWVVQVVGGTSDSQDGFKVVVGNPRGTIVGNQAVDLATVTVYKYPATIDAAKMSEIRAGVEARINDQSTQGTKILSAVADTTINGMRGFTVTCSFPFSGGTTLHSPLYLFFSGDREYFLVLQSTEESWGSVQPHLNVVLNSFKTTQ
jgi:hypothetical protein